MAEAKTPRLDQWECWVTDMNGFKDKDTREREMLLQDLEMNMPARLAEVNESIQKFLEDRLDMELFDHIELASQLINSLEFVASSDLIVPAQDRTVSEQLHRIKELHQQLKSSHVPEYSEATTIMKKLEQSSSKFDVAKTSEEKLMKHLKKWPSELDAMTSEKKTWNWKDFFLNFAVPPELDAMQSETKMLYREAFSSLDTNILKEIEDLQKKLEKARWPDKLLGLFKCIIEAVYSLHRRLKFVFLWRSSPFRGSNSADDRLEQKKSLFQNFIDSKTTIDDLVVVNITEVVPGIGNRTSALQRNALIETEMHCLTKRPVEYVKDLLSPKHATISNSLDVTRGTGVQIVREVRGKVNFIISRDVSNLHKIYCLHLKKEDGWTRLSAILKNDLHCVSAPLPQKTNVHITSMTNETEQNTNDCPQNSDDVQRSEPSPSPSTSTEYDTSPTSETLLTLFPTEGYSHICPENKNVLVEFPAGSTRSIQKISIQLEKVPFKECKYPLTEVVGYGDVICVHHDKDFLMPVQVTMPLTLVEDIDISACDLCCVHIDDNGLTIKDDVKVEIVDGHICRFKTDTFSRVTVNTRRRQNNLPEQLKKYIEELQNLHRATPHNILLFIGALPDVNTWKLHAEVVDESEVKDTITKRREEMSLFELGECRSRSICIKGIKQIEVILGSKGSLRHYKEEMQQSIFIDIVYCGKNNFIHFPVTRKNKDQMAIIYFKAKGKKDVLHKAFFDPRNMNQYQYGTMPQPSASQRIGIIPGTISGTARPIVTAGERVLTTSTPRSPFAEMPVQTSGLFSDRSMLLLAKNLSLNEMWELSLCLGILSTTYDDLKTKHRDNPTELKLRIIKEWLKNMTCSEEEMASKLCDALERASLLSMKNTVESVLKENRAFKITDFQK